MSGDTALAVLVGVVMVVGLAGTVLPILPGIPVIWGAALIYGVGSGFGVVGWVATATISLAAVGGMGASAYLPQRTATATGVPWWGQVIAAVLAVTGLFVIPIVGAPVGFAAGILVTMTVLRRDLREGWQASSAAIRSMLLASVVQFTSGLLMVVVWLAWVLLG
jgi:uncharacterized protein